MSIGHYSKMQDKDELYRLYWTENKSTSEIGKIYGVSFKRVSKWLKRLNIPTRAWSTKGMKFEGRHLSEDHKQRLREWHTGRKLSPEHRQNIISNLKPRRGNKSNFWKGGRFFQEDGYVFIYAPDSKLPTKRVHKLEHRVVMEQHLGRPLTSDEHIHHINGIKDDNRIENLKLVTNHSHAHIHWDNPINRKKQSERLKSIRASKFWSSKKVI